MWLVPRPFCHVTVVLSDEAVARKAAGLKAEAPKPLVEEASGPRRGRRVGRRRPPEGREGRARRADASQAHAEPKGEKGATKSKKPSAKPGAAE